LIDVLEEQLRLIVGGEKVTAKQYRRGRDNVTVETDPSSADFWFYVVDPVSETILEQNSTRVSR